MSIYSLKLDYRKVLRALFVERNKRGSKVTWQILANHIGIQKTYVSKVLNGSADFSGDQLYAACVFFKLTNFDTDYVLLLLDYSRSQYKERKSQILKKIKIIQSKKLKTEEHIPSHVITPSQQETLMKYYLDPNIKLVHTFLSIPRYQKSINKIAEELRMNMSELSKVFEKLEEMNMIRFNKGSYQSINDNFHLPKDSPLCTPSQTLLKVKSLQHIQQVSDEEPYTFTATFTADEKAKKEILDHFFYFIEKTYGTGNSAPQKNIYQINFDLFPWNKVV